MTDLRGVQEAAASRSDTSTRMWRRVPIRDMTLRPARAAVHRPGPLPAVPYIGTATVKPDDPRIKSKPSS